MGDGLLERDAPLAQLGVLARRVARGGSGEVVLLRGEAGVGKTAVLARFVSQLNSGLRVLRGWCDPLAAAEAWTGRGCLYDAALAQLGGDISAVKSALATFRRVGARAAARRAEQRLAALRERVPRTRRADKLSDPTR